MLTQDYGSTITNTYDIMGRLSTATENSTSLTYTYDALGRNLTFTDQAGRESTYTYDLNGNRLTSTYPTSVEVERVYDASNRLWKLEDGSSNVQATYSYDLAGRPTGIALGNSTSVSYSYDLANRLGYVHNTLDSGNRNYSYVYDDASRVTSITEPRGTIDTNHYSDRNELKEIDEPGGSPFSDQSFAYDDGYNRSNWTYGATSTDYTANNLNQYTAVGAATPTWNNDGGLATFGGNTYTYDALGRLTEVDNSSNRVYFTYDPLGRRTTKTVKDSTGSTWIADYAYHYDGSEVAVEYRDDSDPATWTCYLGPGIDQPVMRIHNVVPVKQWYYRDGQGSISAVANNTGDLIEAYEYTAQGIGEILDNTGTVLSVTAIHSDIMYTGRPYDPETGNYFYRARYYNPQLGRFISRDPLSGAEFSQGTNL